MEKSKDYKGVLFSPDVLVVARQQIESHLGENAGASRLRLCIRLPSGETWTHDSQDEFFSDYRVDPWPSRAEYGVRSGEFSLDVTFYASELFSHVAVGAITRSQIESVFEIFENNAQHCSLPVEEKKAECEITPRVFIGHGRSEQWKELKDQLHDKHDYEVEAYEVGARAGHAIRDILEDMMAKSSMAILVMTGEDKDEDGNLRARQNVIHELGLFQGRLGFSRAIILLEQGTEEFSNIQGTTQVRFAKGNIKETFGEVLATLKERIRELRGHTLLAIGHALIGLELIGR